VIALQIPRHRDVVEDLRRAGERVRARPLGDRRVVVAEPVRAAADLDRIVRLPAFGRVVGSRDTRDEQEQDEGALHGL
jgi:hypothetical protein